MEKSKEELLDELISESEHEAEEQQKEFMKKGIIAIVIALAGFTFVGVYLSLAANRTTFFVKELVLLGIVSMISLGALVAVPLMIIKSRSKDEIPE